MAMAMALAPAEESPVAAFMSLGIGMEMGEQQQVQVHVQQQEQQMLEEEQEQGQEQQQESLFGHVRRQPRRQQMPRAPRRCFPVFAMDDPATAGNNESGSRCSYRTMDEETAMCSTVIQAADHNSAKSDLRKDMEPPISGFLRSPTNSTNVSEDGDSSLSCASWSTGELVWAKFFRSPWWPAQVVDERSVGGNTQAHRQSKNDVLVRFFGNYNYAWVDPANHLSKFDMNFEERSKVLTKAFQRGLKEALGYRDFRKLPLKWRQSSLEECQTPHANGKESSEDTGSEAHESERTTSARRRKPKVLYEEEERLHQKPKRNLRRKRIMRELGLCAPYGSPFTFSTNLRYEATTPVKLCSSENGDE